MNRIESEFPPKDQSRQIDNTKLDNINIDNVKVVRQIRHQENNYNYIMSNIKYKNISKY
jgi:hypothetical protein